MVEENDNVETTICEVGGDRLDVFVSSEFSVSRSRASTLISDSLVSVNGQVKKKNYIVQDGDFVEVSMPDAIEYDVQAENLEINIAYEDNDLLVVNKPQDMVVHPSPGHNSGTLVNALMYHVKFLSSVNGVSRPGILHRIDKDTSGLLLIAKNDKSHLFLSEQIKNHSLDRFYEAIVHGTPKEQNGIVNYSIGRDKKDRKKMAAYPADSTQAGIRNACTHYEVLDSFKNFSHIRLKLETGRTHQIRVHMKAIGHPVVGDPLYTSPKLENFGLQGQCLHAKAIGFIHPTTGEHMYFESELPDYFVKVLKKLK